ncbi:unnamed protein product [Notodromas monacha]|uniref:Uncharacterized protein n=1 Tax=Notodromas monacha TaxID=399045 RepID=A0A7R9G828_9CRUS|nr:unnamed protein product [Notodromas monacha]CAG0912847.1 unnamed protein product [Notodromas monacha]
MEGKADFGAILSEMNLHQSQHHVTHAMTSFVGSASFHSPLEVKRASAYSQVDLLESNPTALSARTLRAATLHHPRRAQTKRVTVSPFATIRRMDTLWIRDPSLIQKSVGTDCSLEIGHHTDLIDCQDRHQQLQRESSDDELISATQVAGLILLGCEVGLFHTPSSSEAAEAKIRR